MCNFNIRIVTCMYYSRIDSEMGGRNWPEEYYKWTFFNILSMGLPVTVFCADTEESVNKIQQLVSEFKNNISDVNVEIVKYNLQNHPSYQKIVSHRRDCLDKINQDKVSYPHGFYWTRNEVICHTKIMFLEKVFKLHPDVNNLIWIDAGITHWGLTPRSLGGKEINGYSEKYTDFYPHNNKTMFNPKIGNGFTSLLKEHEIIFTGHNNNWYDSTLQCIHPIFVYERNLQHLFNGEKSWCKTVNGYIQSTTPQTQQYVSTQIINSENVVSIFSKQIVGGIICVNRNKINHLSTMYYDYLNFLLNFNYHTLFTEEPILSLYHALYKPHILEFTDWMHNVESNPENPCTTPGIYKKSFYTIWQDLGKY